MSPLHDRISAWIQYRKSNYPKLRRTHPVGLIDNGRHTRLYVCICGERMESTNRWPYPDAVVQFYRKHERFRNLHDDAHTKETVNEEVDF